MSANIGKDGYQELNQTNLQNAIDSQFGNGKATVIDNEDGTFTVSFIDSKKDYNITSNGVENGVNWNTAMKEANAPENQTTTSKSIIGIGTDGNPVNMDLWEYTLMEDGTYGLNDSTSLSTGASASASKGYLGTNYTNINIPQYISEDNGKNWKEVTNMDWTFFNCTDIIQINKIPNTVKSMRYTFRSCTSLEKINNISASVVNMQSTFLSCTALKNVGTIPKGVTNMQGTFNGCTSIIEVPEIPSNVINMQSTFKNCQSLIKAPGIPEKVTNMQETFSGCISLKIAPAIIPYSVTEFYNTFRTCRKLEGEITILANIDGKLLSNNRKDYEYCFKEAASEGNGLTLKCTDNIYNLFYDGLRENHIKYDVCDNTDTNINLKEL